MQCAQKLADGLAHLKFWHCTRSDLGLPSSSFGHLPRSFKMMRIPRMVLWKIETLNLPLGQAVLHILVQSGLPVDYPLRFEFNRHFPGGQSVRGTHLVRQCIFKCKRNLDLLLMTALGSVHRPFHLRDKVLIFCHAPSRP